MTFSRWEHGWQVSLWRVLILTGSREMGTWWLGIGPLRLIIRAPWNAPLFSERYGHTKTLKIGGGWRLQGRRLTHEQK